MVGSSAVTLARSLRARSATLVAAGLVVLAAWEITVIARARATAPADGDWQAAAAHVAAAKQPGELVVFAPAWVDPVGRRWLGATMTIDEVARMDEARFARIWEVSVRGASAPAVRGLGAPAEVRHFGAVRVRRFDKKPATVSWRVPEGGDVYEVGFQPRRCLRLGGRREWKGVTLGTELVVYAGLSDVWARRDNRAVARVVVTVDGQEQARASVGNDSGWVALPRVATTPGPHDVAIEVGVDPERGDPEKARLETCVAAEARTP
jgi:hypothetical protein